MYASFGNSTSGPRSFPYFVVTIVGPNCFLIVSGIKPWKRRIQTKHMNSQYTHTICIFMKDNTSREYRRLMFTTQLFKRDTVSHIGCHCIPKDKHRILRILDNFHPNFQAHTYIPGKKTPNEQKTIRKIKIPFPPTEALNDSTCGFSRKKLFPHIFFFLI